MLSQSQVNLIRGSASLLAEGNVAVTQAFYDNLFAAAPGVRKLFSEDMFDQSEKLWNSIVTVVESAKDLGEIEDELLAMGARHVRYGALPEHYPVVNDILVATIASIAGDTWTDDHQDAWQAALGAVTSLMLQGATEDAD